MKAWSRVLGPLVIGLVVFANAFFLIRNSFSVWVTAICAAVISIGAGCLTILIGKTQGRRLREARQDAEHLERMTSVLPGIMYECEISPMGEVVVTYVNEAVREVLGLEPERLMRDSTYFMEFVHPDDREKLQGLTRAHCESLEPWRWEYRYVVPKLGVRWVESRGKVQRREDGKLIWNGFITDITERRQMEEMLRLGEERLALATQAGNIGTWDYNLIDRTVTWNDVMYKHHGVTRENYTPTPESDLLFVHPEDRERVVSEYRQHFASEAKECEMSFRLVLRNGDERCTRTSALILRDAQGRAVRAVGISIDRTEQNRVDAELSRARDVAEDSARAKSEFLAVMSHEIRTPMNGIMGYIALLKDSLLDEGQRNSIEVIETSGESLLRLINDVLDLSSVESRHTHLEEADFNVRTCVTECLNILKPVALSRGLELSAQVAGAMPQWIRTDRLRLTQILVNLMGNAVKFTESGSVRLCVVPEKNGGNAYWSFQVKDTGPGIKEELKSRIFEPFFQGDSFAVRRYRGTGLGLTISLNLAKLMGGDITVDSEEGKGSTFTLKIPAQVGKAHEPEATPIPSPQATALPDQPILIVEDDPISRMLCTRLLEKIGCASDAVEGGMEALAACETKTYGLVLMDMQMPGLDGCETSQKLRAREREKGAEKNVPIIALTANAMERDRKRCLEAGMNDFLTKPVNIAQLTAMLHKWMRR